MLYKGCGGSASQYLPTWISEERIAANGKITVWGWLQPDGQIAQSQAACAWLGSSAYVASIAAWLGFLVNGPPEYATKATDNDGIFAVTV